MTTKMVEQAYEHGSLGKPTDEIESLPEVLPVEESEDIPNISTLGLVELLLKHARRLDVLTSAEEVHGLLMSRLLAIALASYALFAVAMIVILNTAPAEAYPQHLLTVPSAKIADGSALGMAGAYLFGLVATTGICLPSFYFFALLAGVRMSMRQITSQILRSKATSAIALIGLLPIYVAVVLGLIVFDAPAASLEFWLYFGLILPFTAGLVGVRSLYRSVLNMANTLAPERRCRRECFLRRLVLSWAAVYTAVSPVMIFRLWELAVGSN